MTIQPATQHPRKIEGSDMYSVDVVVQYDDSIVIGYYDYENEEWLNDDGECINGTIKSWHYSMFV